MKHTHRRAALSLGVVGVASLALTGCVGDTDPQAVEDADCSQYEQYGTFEGDEVTAYGSILDVEADLLNESWAEFETCTGIDIVYEGSSEFETQINVRAQGGNAPDLAFFPQPGLLATMVAQDHLVPAPESVAANVDEHWSDDWKDFGTVDGTLYAAPLMSNVKGYVWYSPSFFEENGYEIPKTLDEVEELTATMAEGDLKPWCVGFGSGEASGWPGTDWLEGYVLRMHGSEVYQQWVDHEIPFNDPRIVESLERVGELLKNPEYVNGGWGDVSTIASTDFGEAGMPILDGDCAMHYQATFYAGFWPEGTTIAEDGDVYAFLLPGTEEGQEITTVGGELVGAFRESDAIAAVRTYLSSPEWAESRVGLGGVTSANMGADASVAETSGELLVDAMTRLQNPEFEVRFDGSDAMPGSVGAGSFWRAMIDWVSGSDAETVLDQVESSWP